MNKLYCTRVVEYTHTHTHARARALARTHAPTQTHTHTHTHTEQNKTNKKYSCDFLLIDLENSVTETNKAFKSKPSNYIVTFSVCLSVCLSVSLSLSSFFIFLPLQILPPFDCIKTTFVRTGSAEVRGWGRLARCLSLIHI